MTFLRPVRVLALAAALGLPGVVLAQAPSGPSDSLAAPGAEGLRGRSGKLLARVVSASRGGPIRILQELFGDSATRQPGIYTRAAAGQQFSLITMLPFGEKQRGRVGRYFMGRWPKERNGVVPEGFIEVTSDQADVAVSPHFRLRDFLTHDQEQVWPKYLVLRDALIDKLELVIADLESRGVAVHRVGVLSGFRSPQYNAKGVRPGGRAKDSRHQYGDAADIFVDNDGNGIMDDLNRDGRVDVRDTRVILESVERVEAEHPELVGGAGLYRSTRTHGPFVHIDARGTRARWGA